MSDLPQRFLQAVDLRYSALKRKAVKFDSRLAQCSRASSVQHTALRPRIRLKKKLNR